MGKVAACFEGNGVPRRDAGQSEFFEDTGISEIFEFLWIYLSSLC
jgi:hypothetical protein